MKQTRQAVRAVKQSIFLDVYGHNNQRGGGLGIIQVPVSAYSVIFKLL
jgi:hypothetical protein